MHCSVLMISMNAPSGMSIGVTVLLLKLIANLVALENMSSTCLNLLAPAVSALTRRIVLSTCCRTGHGSSTSGCRISTSDLMRTWSASTTRMNRYGDRASHWHSPLLQLIQGPRMPFTRTADLEVVSSDYIHQDHLPGNLQASRIFSKLDQLIESNAFTKSSLITNVGACHLWQH